MKNGKFEEEPLACKDESVSIADFDNPEYTEQEVEFHHHTDIQPIKEAFYAKQQ